MMVPKTRRITISHKTALCSKCGAVSKRHSTGNRRIHEIGHDRPVVLDVTYSKHECRICRKHFSIDMSHIAPPRGQFTHRVVRTAVALANAGMTMAKVSHVMQWKYHVRVPQTTIHDWMAAAPKRNTKKRNRLKKEIAA